MSDASNAIKNANLNWIKGSTFPAAPVATYLSLYSTAVNDDDSGTEITGTITGGNRPAVAWGAIATNELIKNTPAVTVTASAAGGGTIVAIAIHTTATPGTGTLIVHKELTAPVVVVAGQSIVIPIDGLTIHIDKPC